MSNHTSGGIFIKGPSSWLSYLFAALRVDIFPAESYGTEPQSWNFLPTRKCCLPSLRTKHGWEAQNRSRWKVAVQLLMASLKGIYGRFVIFIPAII